MVEPAPEDQSPHREAILDWLAANPLPRTPEHPCSYLPGLQAQKEGFLADQLDAGSYQALMDRGFRRSGRLFYAMACANCRRCVPIRVPVATFTPSKSQRRAWRKNQDVTVAVDRPQFSPEKFALYQRYLRWQHPDTPPDDQDAPFREWLYQPIVDSCEVTYSLGGRVVAISIVDVSMRSVSGVYHFYEPEFAARSLGVFSVLAEIEWCRQLGVPYYYLGYWVEGAATMHYKANYRPHELLRDGRWEAAANPAPDGD